MSLRSFECLESKHERPQAREALANLPFAAAQHKGGLRILMNALAENEAQFYRSKGKWSNVLFRAFIGGKGFQGSPCPATNIASDHPCWGTSMWIARP